MIQLGAMPLPSFLTLHSEAKVTPEELSTLKAYLAPWTPELNPTHNQQGSSDRNADAATPALGLKSTSAQHQEDQRVGALRGGIGCETSTQRSVLHHSNP